MNYFAHGRLVVHEPYELAGTALPDWLSAADRGTRLRRDAVVPNGDPACAALARGVLRHLDDDARFHGDPAFLRLEAETTVALRAAHDDPRARAWFLAHVAVEMLLDAWLAEQRPERLAAYYDALDTVDLDLVDGAAADWTTRPPQRLRAYAEAFLEHRFLFGYATDDGLFARLRGVARRVGVPEPVDAFRAPLAAARARVYAAAPALLG